MKQTDYIMRNFIWSIILFVLGACSQEDTDYSSAHTGFQISLVDAGGEILSRQTPIELPDPVMTNFNLAVISHQTGKAVYEGACSSSVLVKEGVYDLIATYGDSTKLALDAPCYYGIALDQSVVTGECSPVSITCNVSNALISVTYTNADKFDTTFESYSMEVSLGDQTVEIEKGSDASAYFPAGSSPSLKFHAYLAGTGKEVAYELPAEKIPTNIKAGHHIRVNLTVTGVASGVGISVDKVTNEPVSVLETIPGEWLPAPKISATGFDTSTKTLEVYETEAQSASIDFAISSPLQELEFSLNFKDENLSSLNGDYVLSELPDEKRIEFANTGINLPMIGYNQASITLSETLTRALHSKNDEVVANEIIIKSVKANDRVNKEGIVTYTINTHKPVFTITALPGDIWTKEFTVSALKEDQVVHGDFSELSKNMKYQFSLDGNSGWTDLAEDLRKDGLQPGTTYYVRGVYRGEIFSEKLAVKTYPVIRLENGDMESWSAEERGYYYNANIFDRNPSKLRVYYPWEGTSFWNTNNDFTTRNRDASVAAFSIVYRYNSFPAVSYTKDAHGGTWAAELRNTAAGRGNTSSSSSSYDFNNVPGELFIGDITVTTGGTDAIPSGDHYDIDKGRAFASRPTGVRFYYKYSPYNSDSWKVYAALMDENGTVIAETTKTDNAIVSDDYQEANIIFDYNEDKTKSPAKIYIYFASSIYSGSELPYHSTNVTTWYGDSQRTDETLSGSVFWVDDISLIYDK